MIKRLLHWMEATISHLGVFVSLSSTKKGGQEVGGRQEGKGENWRMELFSEKALMRSGGEPNLVLT